MAIKPGLLGLVRAHQKLIQTTSDKFYLKGSAKSVKFLSFLKYNKELSLGSGQGSDKLKISFFSLPQATTTYRNWFGDCTVSSKFQSKVGETVSTVSQSISLQLKLGPEI